MPRTLILTASALLAAAVAAPVLAQPVATPYTSALKNPEGGDIGTITVTAAPKGVLLRVQVKGLAPGWHGMHFHEKGACTDDKFASAGGHVHNVTPVTHGFLNKDANDAGDLPNLYVAADGTAVVELYSTLVTVMPVDNRPALMDADGSALVIHGNPDDYASQPVGGAGVRVACAVIGSATLMKLSSSH